jgi:hypothetical protein
MQRQVLIGFPDDVHGDRRKGGLQRQVGEVALAGRGQAAEQCDVIAHRIRIALLELFSREARPHGVTARRPVPDAV